MIKQYQSTQKFQNIILEKVYIQIMKGSISLEKNDYRQAIEMYDIAIQLDPEDYRSYSDNGIYWMKISI